MLGWAGSSRSFQKGNTMKFLRKAVLALTFCAAAGFTAPSFAQAVQPPTPEQARPAPTATPHKAKPAAKPAAKQLIDINTASEEELRALKGVGDIRAANIIRNRPYKGKDELVQKKIIPPAIYAGIKDQIIAKQK
jgi:competence protein ComEA